MKKVIIGIIILGLFSACKKVEVKDLQLGNNVMENESSLVIGEIISSRTNVSDPRMPYVHCKFKVYIDRATDPSKITAIALYRNGSYFGQQGLYGTDIYDTDVSRGQTYHYSIGLVSGNDGYTKRSKEITVTVP